MIVAWANAHPGELPDAFTPIVCNLQHALEARVPAPGSLPKLPQAIFNLEKQSGSG
jgi:hypothetical protein